MDIRRIPLWEGRNAAVLTNDLIRVVIEDRGAMALELSTELSSGGRVNAHALPWLRGTGTSVYSDENSDFRRNNSLFYQKAGSYFCFPNFGTACQNGEIFHETDGYSANGYWMVERYGTDSMFGGAWILSSLTSREAGNRWKIHKVDLLLPGHPVLYTSCTITNNGDRPLDANAAWRNTLGSPFLESGCLLNSSAGQWMSIDQSLNGINGRIASDMPFDDLRKAPLKSGGTIDLTQITGMTGSTDLISGVVPETAKLGWNSVINPRLQLLYFTFFPGPVAQEEGDLPLYFNHFLMDYGGRQFTPWALYDGGTSQVFNLGCGSGTCYFGEGLARSLTQTALMDRPTTVSLAPDETKTAWYASALVPYENPRIGGNFFAVEQVVEGIVAKRTKSWAFIPSDSTFHCLRTITKTLLEEERNG